MAHDHIIILLELLIQLATCVLKSQQEQERIAANNYLSEFKLLMRQMFWIGRHNPSVMEESMYELRQHVYAKDNLEIIDRLQHEKQMNEMIIERDQLKQQVTKKKNFFFCLLIYILFKFEELKGIRNQLENECTILTTANENDVIEYTRKQEEASDEQSKLIELTQIVEQKGIFSSLLKTYFMNII
jgi:hypothetical protein